MKPIELLDLKGDYEINTINDYVVFVGPQLVIYKSDGTFVAVRQVLGTIRKSIFTNDNGILLDCSSKGVYSLISLLDGSEKLRISQPKSDYTCNRFVLSPDARYAYDRCDLRGKYYFVKIDLTLKTAHKYSIKNNFRCVSDLICTESGNPVFLEQHFETIEGSTEQRVSKNGIICAYTTALNSQCSFERMFQWEFSHPQISRYFLGREDTILTKDLQIYKPHLGTLFSLVDSELPLENVGKEPANYRLDKQTNYLTLMYDTANIVVDCSSRKIIARYAAQYRFGCIVGNEYWICADEGVRKMPFPIIETIPPRKHTLWSPWH